MIRDKAKDDTYFNCGQEHEFDYVAGLYGANKDIVYGFLKAQCRSGTISYSTHFEVYKMIEEWLGYSIPS